MATIANLTLDELDEALLHLSLVPEPDRGPAWHAYSDAILDRRTRLRAERPQPEPATTSA